MSTKQLTIFGLLVGTALALAGLGFGAMSINQPFTTPRWVPIIFFVLAGIILIYSIVYLIYNWIHGNKYKLILLSLQNGINPWPVREAFQ